MQQMQVQLGSSPKVLVQSRNDGFQQQTLQLPTAPQLIGLMSHDPPLDPYLVLPDHLWPAGRHVMCHWQEVLLHEASSQ